MSDYADVSSVLFDAHQKWPHWQTVDSGMYMYIAGTNTPKGSTYIYIYLISYVLVRLGL